MLLTRCLAAALGVGAILVSSSGCGGDAPTQVSGTVLIDNKPLPEGEIIFEASDGKKAPGAGPIKDGRYSVSVPSGPKRVKINASRPTAKPDPLMGSAARESMIPPEFNEQTKLKADIQAGGRQENVNFEVRSIR